MLLEILQYVTFDCKVDGLGRCFDPSTGAQYKCDSYTDGGTRCGVNGREVLAVTQGIGVDDNYWFYFLYLCLIFLTFKFFVVLLTAYPWPRISYKVKGVISGLFSSRMNRRDGQCVQATTQNTADKPNDGVKGNANYTAVETRPAMEGGMNTERVFDLTTQASLSWQKVTVCLKKNGQELVSQASGFVTSGRVLALMGPSGAGENYYNGIMFNNNAYYYDRENDTIKCTCKESKIRRSFRRCEICWPKNDFAGSYLCSSI